MYPLVNTSSFQSLLNGIGDRPVVMLGEASHGTHEYYTWRTDISKKLITDKQFNFIAVEGDWPDCYLINRYVKGYADAGNDIVALLKKFDRWPTWMWANWEIVALAEWLRQYNQPLPADRKVGFYGLDVYSLWDSMRAMIGYLDQEDKSAAQYVRKAIACFEPFQEDEWKYAKASLSQPCKDEVLAMLREIRMKAQFLDGDREAGFNTEQNALITVNAEHYYRSMMGFDDQSWNIRDRHMMETLDRLRKFHGPHSKAIVWEHNTHIGDARATTMGDVGMLNTGQLAREIYGDANVYLVGLASYKGTVIAAEAWGAPIQVMQVPEAREDSIEAKLHHDHGKDGYILMKDEPDRMFNQPIPHRAIGVVYDPEREWRGNYVPSVLAKRYDAFIFLDETKALHPLHLKPHSEKIPETFPFGV